MRIIRMVLWSLTPFPPLWTVVAPPRPPLWTVVVLLWFCVSFVVGCGGLHDKLYVLIIGSNYTYANYTHRLYVLTIGTNHAYLLQVRNTGTYRAYELHVYVHTELHISNINRTYV